MEIEQLKLIIQMITGLGEAGKEAFIWWLLLDTVPSFILWSALLVIIYYTIKQIIITVREDEYMCQLRDMLGIGSRGSLTASERSRTKEELLRLVSAHIAKK